MGPADQPRLPLRPETLQRCMTRPIFQPLPVVDLNHETGLYPGGVSLRESSELHPEAREDTELRFCGRHAHQIEPRRGKEGGPLIAGAFETSRVHEHVEVAEFSYGALVRWADLSLKSGRMSAMPTECPAPINASANWHTEISAPPSAWMSHP